jgi:uncharacterized protein YgbK (DUF1537 family)
MSRHPATPMNEADLRTHFAALGMPGVQSIHWPLLTQGAALEAEWNRLSDAPAILFDALEARHVEAIGHLWRVESRKRSLLVVGPSSAAQAYFEERDPIISPPRPAHEGPVLSFVGSLSSITRAQVAAARSYRRIAIHPDCLMTSPHGRERTVEQAVALLSEGHHVMLSTSPEEREAPSAAAEDLADLSALLVDTVLKRHPVRRLAVAGGDTSSKIVGNLGYWGLGYHSQISGGVAVSTARSDDPSRDGMLLMLKGGQMGHEELFETFLEDRAHW